MSEPDEPPFATERWVLIMCDYTAEGVWDRRGRACAVDDLPVADNIRAMIRGWQEWYEYSDLRPETCWFDLEAHAAFGLFIAKLVKQSLPDWTVVYFDESKPTNNWQPGEPRDHFEYEITAAMIEL